MAQRAGDPDPTSEPALRPRPTRQLWLGNIAQGRSAGSSTRPTLAWEAARAEKSMGRDPASSPDVWHGPGSSAAAAVMEQEKGKEGTHVAGIYPSETWCVDILSRPDLSYEVPGFVFVS
jgi:hypothetical protein